MQVKMVDTSLRDGHQSLIATRMTTDEILKVLPDIDEIGYYALEVWGGATFDSCLRFLNEDPWERLRAIKRVAKKTKLQMLLRGQNLLGYHNYPDDIVNLFVKKAIENGIDIIRVFDALNDLRNLQESVTAIKKYGGMCQIALSYTTSPVHTLDYFVDLARKAEELGADSLCIKDMAGVLLPQDAFKLVSSIKEQVRIPLELHTHSTGGVAEMTILKAIEAGVDIVDTALSPFGSGTSQPSTESIQYALIDSEYDPQLNLERMKLASEKLSKIRDHYLETGTLNVKALVQNPNILTYQVPGGMLSNLMSQLQSQGAIDKYEAVLEEVPRVRADLGYPPLVTPLSQMVGTQAVINVLSGKRYQMIPNEIKEYVKGLYGRPPVPISEEMQHLIIGDEEVITDRPADFLKPQFEEIKEKYQDLVKSDEDVLSIALFENVAVNFLKNRIDNKNNQQDFNSDKAKVIDRVSDLVSDEVIEINLYI